MENRFCMFIGNGFDDIEAVTIINLLRRAGIIIDAFGIDEYEVKSFSGIKFKNDLLFKRADDIDASLYKGILLPGGPGTKELLLNEELQKLIIKFNDEKKLIFAICGAPLLLDKAGILKEKRFTCLPEVAGLASTGTRLKDVFVIDGNIITAKALGSSFTAALKLIEVIISKEKAVEIADKYYINKNIFLDNSF